MSLIIAFERYQAEHEKRIEALADLVSCITEKAHSQLVDEMLGVLAAGAANNSTDDAHDQESALSSAEGWVADNLYDATAEEDVAMALWLKGEEAGRSFILENKDTAFVSRRTAGAMSP